MFPYQDPKLPVEERIDDLLGRMTLREKIMQTDQYFSGDFTTQDENGRVTALDLDRLDRDLQGCSVGGGSIRITGMDGMEVLLTGESPTLIVVHRDEPGAIAAVTEALAGRRLNISGFRLDRQKRGGNAVMVLELDGAVGPEVTGAVRALPQVLHVTLLQPV